VIETKGEIVQYVGDEVVLAWSVRHGTRNGNCVRFFFLADERLRQVRDRYVERFGVFPEFKAGLHAGRVVVTEVGKIRKEIAYHGDPMNTTARICGFCHQVQRRLLVSGAVTRLLDGQALDYSVEEVGTHRLKGKEQRIELFGIERLESDPLRDPLDPPPPRPGAR
jgi:adenylate cyclase